MDDNPGITVVPHHLYRNNPKLSELRMRGNSLHSLDTAHLPPLDQLGRLYLANNPFVCNCSLLWLWQLTQNADATRPSTVQPSTTALTNQPADRSNYERRQHSTKQSHGRRLVLVDRANVSCYFWSENTRQRRVALAALSASEIQCPTYYAYVVACTLLAVLAAMVGGGWLLRWRWRRRANQRCARERKHIMDQQQVPHRHHQLQHQHQLEAKMRFDEYGGDLQPEQMQQQPPYYQHQQPAGGFGAAMASTSAAHGGGDPPLPQQLQYDEDEDEQDHYEQFDDYRYEQHRRRLDKQPALFQLGLGPVQPSIVYV